MADTIRDVVIKLAIQQQETVLKSPAVQQYQAGVEAAERFAVDAAKRVQDAWKANPVVSAAEKSANAVSESASLAKRALTESESAVSKAIGANHRYVENMFQVGDSLKQGGEGAFIFARGMALLTSDTEENYKALIQNIAITQGFFDVTKGSFEFIKGGAVAYRTATAAGGIYALTMQGVAGAQALVATTAAAASTAVKALWGPIGIAVAAVGAVWLVGKNAWSAYIEEMRSAKEAATPLIGELERLKSLTRGLAETEANVALEKERIAIDDAATAAERLESISKQHLQTNIALSRVQMGQGGVDKLKQNIIEGDDETRAAAFAVVSKIQGLQENLIAQEKEKLAIYKEQQNALVQNLDKQKSIAESAKAAAQQERDRVAGLQASLGRLNQVQKNELERLGKKAKEGTLTDQEAGRLEQGFGQIPTVRKFVEERYRKKGEGSELILEPFNNGQRITGEGSKLEEALKKEAEAVAKQVKAEEDLARGIKELGTKRAMAQADLYRVLTEYFAEKSDFVWLKEEIERRQKEGLNRDMKGK